MGIKNNKLPRNGQYELFIYANKVHCFDDPSLESFKISADNLGKMLYWLNDQDSVECRRYTDYAWYLQPKAYLIWKLTWA